MWSILKIVICILLAYISWQDSVRVFIQEWILNLNLTSMDLYISRFVLCYIVFHFIPFRWLFRKWYRDNNQWMIYARNFEHDGCYNEILSDEESCQVFDPDDLHSSSSLSSFLSHYEREDWEVTERKLRKSAWNWSSDDEDEEEEERKVVSPDNGYGTRSKTNDTLSEIDLDREVPEAEREHLKRKLEYRGINDNKRRIMAGCVKKTQKRKPGHWFKKMRRKVTRDVGVWRSLRKATEHTSLKEKEDQWCALSDRLEMNKELSSFANGDSYVVKERNDRDASRIGLKQASDSRGKKSIVTEKVSVENKTQKTEALCHQTKHEARSKDAREFISVPVIFNPSQDFELLCNVQKLDREGKNLSGKLKPEALLENESNRTEEKSSDGQKDSDRTNHAFACKTGKGKTLLYAEKDIRRTKPSFASKTKRNNTPRYMYVRREARKKILDDIWKSLRNGKEIKIDFDIENLPPRVRKPIDLKVEHFVPEHSLHVPVFQPSMQAHPDEGEQDQQDKQVYSGFTFSGAVKLGMFAVGFGLGGFLVYKLCSRK